MMEVTDLPVILRLPQRALDPRELSRVHEIAVDYEEPNIAFGVRVVTHAAHVEWRISLLTRIVVVPERGVELDAGVQQRPVGFLELADEVPGILTSVEIVAQHDDQLERKPSVIGD